MMSWLKNWWALVPIEAEIALITLMPVCGMIKGATLYHFLRSHLGGVFWLQD